ncbi:hypothetical protein NDU88_002885 [Pleurodeles waltl]|uniref:Uncharacterized protein n=1 Tax=Pleurodeles waltl TaxID=8319 RepID=A0AAV7W356_PLEWA|nr:hypothetical protein NDU88_002885 [Pleurodeles waltl]
MQLRASARLRRCSQGRSSCDTASGPVADPALNPRRRPAAPTGECVGRGRGCSADRSLPAKRLRPPVP